jgi:hypothetical protein
MREQLYVLTHWRDGSVTRSADMPPGYARRFAERMRSVKKVLDVKLMIVAATDPDFVERQPRAAATRPPPHAG